MVFVVLFGVQTYPVGQTTATVWTVGTHVYPVGHRTAVPVFVVAAWVIGVVNDPIRTTTAMVVTDIEVREDIECFILIVKIIK
jgi:hypothetical protein